MVWPRAGITRSPREGADAMNINGIASLRNLLATMEKDFGLEELTPPQRDVLYAANLLSDAGDPITATNLTAHPLLRGMARSTFFRSLKHLIDNHYLLTPKGKESGRYQLGEIGNNGPTG